MGKHTHVQSLCPVEVIRETGVFHSYIVIGAAIIGHNCFTLT